MSRPLRLQYPGSVWHITARGNNRRDIFFDDNDRVRFLELLAKTVETYGWILTAYVMMSNHFHLLVEMTEATLSRGMQWLDGEYARWINWRHGRVGHLYQGRFKSHLIEKDTYFLNVLRYIVLNPVRGGIVQHPEDYQWSSHSAVMGHAPVPTWLDADDVLASFGDDRGVATQNYSAFVNQGIGSKWSPWDELVAQTYLGSPQWVEALMERAHAPLLRRSAHPQRQPRVARPSMNAIVSAVATAFETTTDEIFHSRGGVERMAAAWVGRQAGLLRNEEIAAALGFNSAGHVTRLIQRCEDALRSSHDIKQRVDDCVATLGRRKKEKSDPTTGR